MKYEEINFVGIYRQKVAESVFRRKTEADWDSAAEQFRARHHEKTFYVRRFLQLMNLQDVSSVLDFGSGSGTLSLPLAERVQQVVSADFSAQMLSLLEEDARERGLDNIKTFKKSWSENWDDLPQVDMVIASRCIGSSGDIVSVVEKMVQKARLRVAFTWMKSPGFVNPLIMEAIGRQYSSHPDWIYPVNILYQLGYDPEVNFIPWDPDPDKILEEDGFIGTLEWKVGELAAEEVVAARRYFHDYVLKDPLKYGHLGFSWAYISWENRKR